MKHGRRGLIAVLLIGVGTGLWWTWRNNKKVRERVQQAVKEVVRRSHTVRELVRKVFKHQAASDAASSEARVISGLDAPEARPLSTVDQFLRWSPDPTTDPDAPFCRTYNSPLLLPAAPPTAPASTPKEAAAAAAANTSSSSASTTASPAGTAAAAAASSSSSAAAARPRLLVCHDMMGGYLADRLVQGGADPGFFRLWQWDQIDVFIYFSHHLITLPPPGWTAAAHRNGVRVLGTFITEWEEGKRRCEALFASPASARAAADQLVALAVHHGFEGWLVNVENGLGRELVPHLAHFVAHLRARMAAEVGPHALVVWYDAITTEGKLAWQDGLTRLNAPFFDAADALFVNYRWQEGAPAAVAAAAGSRAAEVYMGVDVFGRGSFGGGKENCPVALAAARAAGVSAALFAPGWVFEEFDRATFEPRQEAFWAAIRAVWPARPALVQRLPLCSAFNTGAGRALWLEGRQVSAAPWFNLSAQDVVASTTPLPAAPIITTTATTAAAVSPAPSQQAPQPPKGSTVLPPAAVSPLTVRPTALLAYTGGACLALIAPPPPPPSLSSAGPWVAMHALYSAAVPLDPGFAGSGIASGSGLDLAWTAACAGSSRVGLLLRTAPAEVAGSAGCCVGLAVAPWGPADKQVVEALRKAGYTCVACPAGTATGAVTCPLPDVPTATAPAAAAATIAVPAGLPWVTYSAHLPRRLFPVSGAGSSSGSAATGNSSSGSAVSAVGGVSSATAAGGGSKGVITSVGIVCYHAAGSSSGGLGATAGAGGATAAKSGFFGSAEPLEPSAPFSAFLGLLSIREHRGGPDPPAATPAATSSAAVAAAPIAVTAPPAPATPPPLLTGAAVSRVRWARPAALAAAGAGSSDASATALAASAAAAIPGLLAGPRASGEIIHKDDEDDDWERGSSGGGGGRGSAGGAAAGPGLAGLESPVKVQLPTVGDDEDEEEVAAATGGVGRALGLGLGLGLEDDGTRLLTCEVSWAPQFEAGGAPRHRSYHVWAHFNRQEAPAGGVSVPLPGIASPTGPSGPGASKTGGMGKAGASSSGSSKQKKQAGTAAAAEAAAAVSDKDSTWEVLHPDWSGAVWAGEAHVAAYRLVQLEVPGWARSVSLLAQPVAADSGALGALQPLACVPVPAQL